MSHEDAIDTANQILRLDIITIQAHKLGVFLKIFKDYNPNTLCLCSTEIFI